MEGKRSISFFGTTRPLISRRRIAGLALEVKGDFCEQLSVILDDAGRAEDYVAQEAHAFRASAPRIKTSTPTHRFSCPAR